MLPLVYLIILGIDWASGYAIAGYCMNHGVNPYGYAFWQSFGPLVILLLIQLLRREVWLDKAGIAYSFLCAIFGIVIPNLLIYFSAKHLPSGLLTVIANISPIFTYLLALVLQDEDFDYRRALFVLIGLFGILLIVWPNGNDLVSALGSGWILISLLIPLSYAFSAVYISKFHPGRGDILNYALWMLIFSTLCISPLAVVNRAYYELHINDLTSWLIIIEIILSSFGYALLFIILRKVGAVYYSLVNGVAALTGIVYGYLIFRQSYSLLTYFAVGIIIVAIAGLTYTQKKLRR